MEAGRWASICSAPWGATPSGDGRTNVPPVILVRRRAPQAAVDTPPDVDRSSLSTGHVRRHRWARPGARRRAPRLDLQQRSSCQRRDPATSINLLIHHWRSPEEAPQGRCSATARCARRWTSSASSCRPWPARRPTAWAPCCCRVRVGELQPQLKPGTIQAALTEENGLVIGVELSGLELMTITLHEWDVDSVH